MSVNVVELSPLKAHALRWLPERGGPRVTVICKATFPLAPGVAALAPAQDDVNKRDLHAENNPQKGLYSASDLAPYKHQADVTLVGKCFAKPGELAKMLPARLRVAGIDKCVEVYADRFFGRDGKLTAGNFFSKMALGYERAAGGSNNPVGVKPGARSQNDGSIKAPNLQKPGTALRRPDDVVAPTGFGPIPGAWDGRRGLLNNLSQAWVATNWEHARPPADFDWNYFNVAPLDQRLAVLRGDETLRLDHLHPEHPELRMQLPGLRPCVFVELDGQGQALQMNADTLWIDTNRLLVTLCWRGQIEVDATQLRVLVAMAQPGQDLAFEQVMDHARQLHQDRAEKRDLAASEAKTKMRPARASSAGAMGSRMTSPVPLVPSADMAPAWLPPPSSDRLAGVAAAPSSSRTSSAGAPRGSSPGGPPSSSPQHARAARPLEVPLSESELQQLQQLAAALQCSLPDALRYALQESHRARFKRG